MCCKQHQLVDCEVASVLEMGGIYFLPSLQANRKREDCFPGGCVRSSRPRKLRNGESELLRHDSVRRCSINGSTECIWDDVIDCYARIDAAACRYWLRRTLLAGDTGHEQDCTG